MNQIGKSAQITVPANASPARTARIIKKVDLGAAANYGKEQSNVSLKLFFYFYIVFLIHLIFCVM